MVLRIYVVVAIRLQNELRLVRAMHKCKLGEVSHNDSRNSVSTDRDNIEAYIASVSTYLHASHSGSMFRYLVPIHPQWIMPTVTEIFL